jgi:proline iminopeptidase
MILHLTVDALADGTPVEIGLQISGDPDGLPVMYCHGGPGDSSNALLLKLFDPKKYYVCLVDQRGCGTSRPRNHLAKNTTPLLLKDMAQIQAEVFQDRPMVLAGGSWGTSLAMLYALKHPKKVLGLILRGVYDLSSDESVLDAMYPEQKDVLRNILPHPTKRNIARALRVDGSRKKSLVRALGQEHGMYVVGKPPKHKESYEDLETLAVVGNHYELHHYFVKPQTLVSRVHTLKMPVIMVDGRFDPITPMKIAYSMCKKMKQCELRNVPAGHTFKEPHLFKELKKAADDMHARLT